MNRTYLRLALVRHPAARAERTGQKRGSPPLLASATYSLQKTIVRTI
jgi:hypothetical protein